MTELGESLRRAELPLRERARELAVMDARELTGKTVPKHGEMLAEVAREPRAANRRRGSWLAGHRAPALRIGLGRPSRAVLLIVAVLAGTVAAVPPVRAALGELSDTLAGYFDGEDPPGRPLESSDSPPAWLVEDGHTGQRVLASSGPYSLYLAHSPSGLYDFGLDDSVGIGDTAAGWERQFADNAVVILGPGARPDADGRRPLYGLTAGDVAEVELRYEDGSATTAPAQTGGFVLMIDMTNGPTELVALDQDGQPLQVVNAHRFADEPRPESRRAHPAQAENRQRPQVTVVGEPVPDDRP